jgi:hypothetical protein
MKVIIYKSDDGGMTVVYPAYQPEWNKTEQDEFLLFVQNKDVPKMTDGSTRISWIIEGEETLKLRYLRIAWKVNNDGQMYFDRNTAEELKKEQFRNLRKPLLEKLDVQFMRALEVGDTSTIQIVTQKKSELRDITSVDFSSYDTPQKLHEFIPDLLKT